MWDLTGKFVLVGLLIQLVEAFGADLGGMSDPRELGSKQMPLFAWEWRATVDGGVEISGENVFNLFGKLDLQRFGVRKLNPVLQKVFGYPKNMGVGAFAPLFFLCVL